MRIAEIFRHDIHRDIPEVIKVDFDEEEVVASEIDEYVVTSHIARNFDFLLDHYQETILNPDEGTTVWVSGFFGSGKSSFAKIFGYLLANPTVVGKSVKDRFLARVNAPTIDALLNTILETTATHAVFVDMSTGTNVARDGESVVLPLYRALLESLGYSRNILLAELEFDLEGDGELEAFIEAFSKIPSSRGLWEHRRNVGLARAEASHAMHLLRPDTFPHADSWSTSAADPIIDSNWFADRAIELLSRRGGDLRRIAFVVDEVGQYVSRSVQRIQDLQGLAEAVQKKRGPLWLVVTSQERLEDVVDSLEGRRVELARVQARFPLRVDLLPADIDEVAGKRVLDKSAKGEQAVRTSFTPSRNKLTTNVRLDSPTRADDFAEEEFVRLYPMLPYQIELLIDSVSARRAQGGNVPMLGGSNRTIIKLAQQLIVDARVGLGKEDVGALVTLDRAYDLLDSIIPTSWRAEVERVADRYGNNSVEVTLAKTIALTMDVSALPLHTGNLAVMLHPSVVAENRRDEIATSLEHLVRDEVVRQGDTGYRLQSPQEKDWEKTRKQIEPRPADIVRLHRELLRGALGGLSVTEGRTFKAQIVVEGEKVADGDISLQIEEGDDARISELRTESRESHASATIWWSFSQGEETYDTLVELHRSKEMVARRDAAVKAAEELELLGEERNRLAANERAAVKRLSDDLVKGQLIFRGNVDDPQGSDLRSAAAEAVRGHVRDIYAQLDHFSAQISRSDVMTVLKADDLRGLPDALGDVGIGLTRLTPSGVEIALDRDPLKAFVDEIRIRASYGTEVTGSHLERKFSASPYGAPVEVIQALAAAAIRAGAIEIVSQGARLTRADDARLEGVLGPLPKFRAASFRLQSDDEVDLGVRTDVAARLGALTGSSLSPSVDALAPLIRTTFAPDADACDRIRAAFGALQIKQPEAVERTADIVKRLIGDSDTETVRTAAETWADLIAARDVVHKLDVAVREDLDSLRAAMAEIRNGSAGLDEQTRNDLTELKDLLEGGTLADDLGKLKSLTAGISAHRKESRRRVLEALREAVEQQRERLKNSFSHLDPAVFDEAARPLTDLVPGDDVETSIDVLEPRADAVLGISARVRVVLEELSAVGEIARVQVAPLMGDLPITSEEELDVALKRVRDAVEDELGAGKKQVYLE